MPYAAAASYHGYAEHEAPRDIVPDASVVLEGIHPLILRYLRDIPERAEVDRKDRYAHLMHGPRRIEHGAIAAEGYHEIGIHRNGYGVGGRACAHDLRGNALPLKIIHYEPGFPIAFALGAVGYYKHVPYHLSSLPNSLASSKDNAS